MTEKKPSTDPLVITKSQPVANPKDQGAEFSPGATGKGDSKKKRSKAKKH